MPLKKKVKTDDTHLIWSDNDEVKMLKTNRDFKVGKAYESVDWESVKE